MGHHRAQVKFESFIVNDRAIVLLGGQDENIFFIFPNFPAVSPIFPQIFLAFSSSFWSSGLEAHPPGKALATPLAYDKELDTCYN